MRLDARIQIIYCSIRTHSTETGYAYPCILINFFPQKSKVHHHFFPFERTFSSCRPHLINFFIFFNFSRRRQGTRFDTRYPILILLVLFLFGGVCSLFLPETLHQKLPDSMEEARLFGAEQVCASITSWLSIFRLSIDIFAINRCLRLKRCEWK